MGQGLSPHDSGDNKNLVNNYNAKFDQTKKNSARSIVLYRTPKIVLPPVIAISYTMTTITMLPPKILAASQLPQSGYVPKSAEATVN